jgi:hypothetical protein
VELAHALRTSFSFFVLFLTGNTRVISQTALDHFRTSLQTKRHDPYSVLLRRNKLPMQLLDDAANPNLRKVCHQLLLIFKTRLGIV